MGIRIHKMIGYGLDDVKYDTEICDPRFSKNNYIEGRDNSYTDNGFNDYLETIITQKKDGYSELNFLKQQRLKAKENGEFYHQHSINHCVVYDPEFGLNNVVLFIPPGSNDDWQRLDSTIDYYEPSHHESTDGVSSGVTMINRSIWPFDSYVDCRTTPPVRLNNTQWHLFIDSRQISEYSEKMAEMLAEEMNFESITEMYEMIRPIIPNKLVVLLRYLNIFKDEKDIHTLKPMLYWYWG